MAASSFAGRAVLVTGAGNGIGKATALHLAALGATVGVVDLRENFVAGTVAAIEPAGGTAIGLTRDLSVREAMQDAVSSFAAEAGRLDGLVNNAAWVRYQSLAEIAPETVERMLNIGFKAIIWGMQAAAAAMAGPGAIVNWGGLARWTGVSARASCRSGKEGSSFSVEKEAKRLLSVCAGIMRRCLIQTDRNFLVIFYKKEQPFLFQANGPAARI